MFFLACPDLLIEAGPYLQVGSRIELIVHMGAILDDGPQIRLQVQGTTVRSGAGRAAVAIRRYRLGPEGMESGDFLGGGAEPCSD